MPSASTSFSAGWRRSGGGRKAGRAPGEPHGRGDVFGSDTEELMEMLRSAATYIDVELRETEPDPDFTMAAGGLAPQQPGGNAGATGLDFVLTGVARLTAAFLLLLNTKQLAELLSNMSVNTGQIAFYSAVIDLLGFALVLGTRVSAVGFGRRMARKQVYKRLSTRFEELG